MDARDVFAGGFDMAGFDGVHVSPPCQTFTRLGHLRDAQGNAPGERADADLLGDALAWVSTLSVPWVIENVPGAPLPDATVLCGSAFGLQVQRHRLFASSTLLLSPGCAHGLYVDGRPWGMGPGR